MEDEFLELTDGLEDVDVLKVTNEGLDVLVEVRGTINAGGDLIQFQITSHLGDETGDEFAHVGDIASDAV